jgi:thymidylate synthase
MKNTGDDDKKAILTEKFKETAKQAMTVSTSNPDMSLLSQHQVCMKQNTTISEENQYLDAIKDILLHGKLIDGERTSIGTISKWGVTMRFSLRDGSFPLLTTKSMPFRFIVEELLWMLRGQTDSKILSSKGVPIWDGNSSRAFLDAYNLKTYETGDCGPVYGFQWRHFGAKYIDCKTDYKGQGVDQIAYIIEEICKNPFSRRLLLSAWNPLDLKKMVLPPCHVSYQFGVTPSGELNCCLYQRSGDMGLGVPFNIASASLLTILIAKVCKLKPGELVHNIADAHIYKTHVDLLKQQIQREPYPFPRLVVTLSSDQKDAKDNLKTARPVEHLLSCLTTISIKEIKLENYKHHEKIVLPLAV